MRTLNVQCRHFMLSNLPNLQGVSELRVLILTSERTRQFMKLFSITF
jgi:hypothetical protein